MNEYSKKEAAKDQGFTLIELLIAIVVVGVLTAVAIVGISSLVNSGEDSACNVTRDAAQAAQAVHYANTDGAANITLAALVAGNYLQLTGGATVAADAISAPGWTLTRTAAVAPAPDVYACT